MADVIERQLEEFGLDLKKINCIYDSFAQHFGLTFSSLSVLKTIFQHPEGCTQKTICDERNMPKQTVNVIIKDFEKRGYIVCLISPEDKRQKLFSFSEEGKQLRDIFIPRIREREISAFGSLPESDRAALLKAIGEFAETLNAGLDGAKEDPELGRFKDML